MAFEIILMKNKKASEENLRKLEFLLKKANNLFRFYNLCPLRDSI